jgi:hypothetical protein
MNSVKSLMIGAVGLAVLAGAVILFFQAHMVGAAEPGASWDQYQQCKIDCNENYGGVDTFPPALRGGESLGWSNCVLRCERTYWKQFDKETGSDN